LDFARLGNYEGVAKSIDHNYNDDSEIASINYQEPKSGYSALHYAVKSKNHQLVSLLLMNNIDCKMPDS
jgi:ankyrin repeat protein